MRSRSGQRSKSSLFSLSATETGLITPALLTQTLPRDFPGDEEGHIKYGPYIKQRSWSMSGQIRSPNKNVVKVSCDTYFMGH